MSGAYLYQSITEPVRLLPYIPPTIPMIENAAQPERLPYVITPADRRAPFAAMAALMQWAVGDVSPAGSNTVFIGLFLSESHTIVGRPGAYYYEQMARPILPLPSAAPAVVFVDAYSYDYPFHWLTPVLSGAASNSAIGSQYKGLTGLTPVSTYAWRDYTQFPNRYPHEVAQIAAAMGQVANVFPITIPPFVALVSSYNQEWFPQWQKPSPVAALANIQSLTQPVLPQPFVNVVSLVTSYFQEWFPQQQTLGRYNGLLLAVGQVNPILPIPFVPPPPGPCVGNPLGTDPNAVYNMFGGNAHPTAVLFCRICQSAKPLLVRSDGAIWCQDCCKYVTYEQTYMLTTRQPTKFRSVF